MQYKAVLFLVFLLISPVSGWAAERVVKFDLGLGLTVGGDELAYATFTDGNTEKIKAGELIHLYAGVLLDFPDTPLSTRLAIGYHFDSITAENGEIDFSRKPLEIIPFYNFHKNHRIGLGLTYHLDPKLTSDVLPDLTFDDSLGFVAEYGYGFGGGSVWLGLRYVGIDYDPAQLDGVSVTGESADGSHFGLYLHTAL
jgi:hypothetical protein